MKKDKPGKNLYEDVVWLIEPEYDWIDKYREGLAPIAKKGKWGFVNSDGIIVISPQFGRVMEFSEGLAGVYTGNKWGFINKIGQIVIVPQFDEPPDVFHEGLAKVAIKSEGIRGNIDLYGFIDNSGMMVLPPFYNDAGYFSSGLAPARIDNKYGYIDKTGRFVLGEIFDHALSFSNNKALVCIDQKWGLIKHPLYANSLNEHLERQLSKKSLDDD